MSEVTFPPTPPAQQTEMASHSTQPTSIGPVTGPVIVACDGASTSKESLFSAARLAGASMGGPVELLGVVEPTPAVAAGLDMIPAPIELDDLRRASMLEDIHRTVSIAPYGDPTWRAEVKSGSPARTLANEAAARHAAVLVMGIGRHNPLDRLFGAETTLATLRHSTVPILAVSVSFPQVLTQVMVAMDFSAASMYAAKMAIQMMDPNGRLILVHVRPSFEHPNADWQAWDAEYGRTLPPLFEKIQTQLETPSTMHVETVTVRGDPAPALLAYAQQIRADLIAMGTQRHGLMERLMVGSVATRVLRTARCAVLAVPGAAVPGAVVPGAVVPTAPAT